MHELALVVAVQVLDVEGLGEVLPQVVRRAGLQGLAVLHHGLDGVGAKRPGEFFRLAFAARNYWHGQPFLVEFAVDLQHLKGFRLGLVGCFVGGVPLLPEELRGAQEEPGAHLPADDVAPLVDQHGQVPVALDPLGVHVADHGLRSGAHHQAFFQFLATGVSDHGQFGRKAFHVLGLLLDEAFGNQQREVGVDVAGLLEHAVQLGLHVLPDGVAVGTDHHAALHRRMVGQFPGGDHVQVPLGIVLLAGGDVLGHPFLSLAPGNNENTGRD